MEYKDLSDIRIETYRLSLRPITLEYTEDIFREFTYEITALMYPRPAKEIGETEEFIRRSMKSIREGTDMQMVILSKELEFLGCAGLHGLKSRQPELGVWLKRSAHGNGYGKEAIQAIKQWASENLDYDHLLYPVAKNNAASRKIAEALGGKIQRQYKQKGLGGNEYHCLEYHI